MLARTHLPELRRDEITRVLSEIHLPDLDVQDAIPKLELPKIEMTAPDVRKAIADAGQALRFGRRTQRPRWLPAALGLALATAGGAIAGWVIFRDRSLREPLARAVGSARMAIAGVASSVRRRLGQRMDLIALDVAVEPAAAVPVAEPPVAAEPIAPMPAASSDGQIAEPELVESGKLS